MAISTTETSRSKPPERGMSSVLVPIADQERDEIALKLTILISGGDLPTHESHLVRSDQVLGVVDGKVRVSRPSVINPNHLITSEIPLALLDMPKRRTIPTIVGKNFGQTDPGIITNPNSPEAQGKPQIPTS